MVTNVEAIAVITLDSPANRNALSQALLTELRQALDQIAESSETRGVLLRSSQRVFSSGADLTEASSVPMDVAARSILSTLRRILSLPVPVVARVDGPTRAGGIGILAACDIVVADESATYAFTEARLGLAPAVISTAVIPVLTSRAAALSFLTAGTFDGKAAEAWGLITMSVPATEIDDAVANVISNISACSRQGLEHSKRLLTIDALMRIDDLGDDLADLSSELFGSDEAKARMKALLAG